MCELGSRRLGPKRTEKPKTPSPHRDDADDGARNGHRQKNHAEPPPPPAQETAFRSSSPPIPTLNNKGKKAKAKKSEIQRPPVDEEDARPTLSTPPTPLAPFTDNDGYIQMPSKEAPDSHSQQTYRKPPTPRQPGSSKTRSPCLSPRTHPPYRYRITTKESSA